VLCPLNDRPCFKFGYNFITISLELNYDSADPSCYNRGRGEKMKHALLLSLLLLVFSFSNARAATKTVALPGLVEPRQLLVGNAHIYVVDFPTVSVYRLKDFSLIRKFGKRGEGPQEFKQYINVFFQDVEPDHLVISSIGKISFYSRQGEFIKEVKIPFGGWTFQPLGQKFMGHTLGGTAKEGYKALNLYDSRLNKIKEIYRKEMFFDDSIKKRTLFASNYRYWTHDNKIYVVAKNDFIIEIFDHTGKPLPPIERKNYKRVKCAEKHRKSVLDFFQRNPRIRPIFERFKKQIQFPGYFPAIRQIDIDEGKIYALTYNRADGKNEFFIFSMDGKLLHKKFLPLKSYNGVTPLPFYIKKGLLYQLVENEDEERWELHIHNIVLGPGFTGLSPIFRETNSKPLLDNFEHGFREFSPVGLVIDFITKEVE
jgi:hypothetical protein